MATLYLICGLPCAGKTTLARQLENTLPALRLTPDEWHIPLYGQDAEEEAHDARHTLIEVMLWGVAARVLALGVDVILDFGFWAKSERDDYLARAAALGAEGKVNFLDVSLEELIARLKLRNDPLSLNTFFIPEENLIAWSAFFEPPTQNELKHRKS